MQTTLLEKMTASHLGLLSLGFSIEGSKESAIAYANERSTAGSKAKAMALATFSEYVGYLSYLARNEPRRTPLSVAEFAETCEIADALAGVASPMHY
jgi:hypothetical protein